MKMGSNEHEQAFICCTSFFYIKGEAEMKMGSNEHEQTIICCISFFYTEGEAEMKTGKMNMNKRSFVAFASSTRRKKQKTKWGK